MNINQIQGFTKYASFHLNLKSSSNSKPLWYIKRNSDKYKGSQVYLLVVNDIIKKIGASVQPISKIAGYGCGNGGSPSDRTTGIHYYIGKELALGNKVEYWYQKYASVNIEIMDLNGGNKTISCPIDPKIMENHHLNTYFNLMNNYPDWNHQEQGRKKDWEPIIKQINSSLKNKKKIEYIEDETNKNILLQLYHWKHTNIMPSFVNSLQAN